MSLLENATKNHQHTSTKEVCRYFQLLLFQSVNNSDNVDYDDLTSLSSSAENGWNIFRLNGTKKHMLEINLIISSLALVISFIVYALLPHLRTVPGKCLMGLIFSELVANVLLFIKFKIQSIPQNSICILKALLLHYFFLTILTWTNLIAFDIMKKIRYPTTVLRDSKRYFIIAYISPLLIISLAFGLDLTNIDPKSMLYSLKPNYGGSIGCGINNLRAYLLFVTLPTICSFCFNFIIFILAINKIKSTARTIKFDAHNSFSTNNQRFFWYLKLCILLGVLNLLSFIGNIFVSRCQIANFVILMFLSSHGTFIFIAFVCKKSIFRLLYKHFASERVESINERTPTFIKTQHPGSFI